MKIAPSILACDFSKIGEEIKKVSDSGADMIHIDIMDGHFVPNISFGPSVVKSVRKATTLPFDVHLMIENPIDYIKSFIDAGADIITFHIESKSDTLEVIKEIKKYGKKVGISSKPKTDIKCLLPYLKYIDVVLIMTVEPGFGGQKFMEGQLEKAVLLKNEIQKQNLNVKIQLDGGINFDTIEKARSFPVDICVSGTCVFKSDNTKNAINILKSGV